MSLLSALTYRFKMVDQYTEIFITGLDGTSLVVRFLKEDFPQTTVYSLRFQVEFKTKVSMKEQLLTFEGRKLDEMMDCSVMSFEDYGILPGATVVMNNRLIGGELEPIDSVDINKKKKFKKTELLFVNAKDIRLGWRKVESGLCFTGVCLNTSCKAKNDIVAVNKGFLEERKGICVVNIVMHQLNCPMCDKEIDTSILQGIGLYKCKATVEAMRKTVSGKKKHRYEIEAKDFVFAYSLNEKGRVKYMYIEITVKPLEQI